VRGLDERFTGPVCGLFRYTDDCGIEYIVVADSSGIFIRTPFDIPVFLGSDSLPNDEFTQDAVDTSRWLNTDDYATYLGSLVLTNDAALIDSGEVPASRLMQWFKASAVSSYQVEIEYALVAGGDGQVVAVAIKSTGATYLIANVYLRPGGYTFNVQLVTSGTVKTLDSAMLGGAELANGFLRLGYNAETFTVTCRVIPSGGDQVTLTATLSEAQNNNLGQNSLIGIATESNDACEIVQVTGGNLGS
jgi:hypothetical protein